MGQSCPGAGRAKQLGSRGGCFPACCNNVGCTKTFGSAGVGVAAWPQGLTRAEPRGLSSPRLQPAEASPPGENKPRRASGLHTQHWLEATTGLIPVMGKCPGMALAFSPHCCNTQTPKAPPPPPKQGLAMAEPWFLSSGFVRNTKFKQPVSSLLSLISMLTF